MNPSASRLLLGPVAAPGAATPGPVPSGESTSLVALLVAPSETPALTPHCARAGPGDSNSIVTASPATSASRPARAALASPDGCVRVFGSPCPCPVPPAPPTEDVAIARKILVDNAGVIGIFPAPPLTGKAWPVVVRLGRALRMLASKPVGLLRGPADAQVPGDRVVPSGAAYRLRELDDWQLIELMLPRAVSLGEAAENLERAVREAGGNFSHLVVDLDGYLPDVREVLELPDAFVSVALAGGTRERDLIATVELLPTSRHLGTLLVD